MPRLARHVLTVVVLLFSVPMVRGGDLDLPPEKIEGGSPAGMMRRYLLRQAEHAAMRWKVDYEKRKTPEAIAAYQKTLRRQCLDAIGGLPERTPLAPQVVGTVSRPGYRVEKIIFESQPKHYVTGLLFLPQQRRFQPPYPGVLIPCGHTVPAKGHPEYQSMGALLALNGMAALVFDPIDQGERGQYFGKGGWPELTCVAGHINVGMGCILLGRNTARFEIWDGMRGIDYLQSRPEVDPQRIGCTGNSGGGTQTSYMMALDERVRSAAPSCYITSLPKLLATIGPQDSEQHFFGQLAFPMDHADLIMMRAPSPVLICAATRDFFDIGGVWDTFRCAKRLYTRMGFAERVDLMENDAGHNYNTLQREAVARWMSRWLLHKNQVIAEPPITLLSEQEYQCTPHGKVMSLPGARSVYDLNEDYENQLASRRAASWASGDREARLEQVRRLAGIRKLSQLPKPVVESLGTVARAGYKIEKLLIKPEEGISLPALLFLPEKPKPGQIVLYVHQQGKAADAAPGGPIEQLVGAGQSVLAVDLRGTGQTQAPASSGGYSDEFRDAYLAYMLGRSYVGMRAEDVLAAARYAAGRRPGGQGGAIRLVAVGSVGVPALHAAALEPSLFQSVKIRRMLASWSSVIHGRLNKGLVTQLVHGALMHYDLPDLAASLENKITVEQPVDALGVVLQESKQEK
jgi:plasmid stabilization system protein ParE